MARFFTALLMTLIMLLLSLLAPLFCLGYPLLIFLICGCSKLGCWLCEKVR